MSVYVDDAAIMYRSKPRFHLAADSLPELHAFCKSVGINRCWFHNAKGHPHYDITAPQREAAIAAGAIPMTDRELSFRTESGRKILNRLISESANDPVEQAKWLAMVPVGESAVKPKQEELF
jgi:hypothetical protein